MRKLGASPKLQSTRMKPNGAKVHRCCKYRKYAWLSAGWCSATESTNGFPVLVCLTKSPRTLEDMGPKYPLGKKQRRHTIPTTAAVIEKRKRYFHASFLPIFFFLIFVSMKNKTWYPRNTAQGPSCSKLFSGAHPTTGREFWYTFFFHRGIKFVPRFVGN